MRGRVVKDKDQVVVVLITVAGVGEVSLSPAALAAGLGSVADGAELVCAELATPGSRVSRVEAVLVADALAVFVEVSTFSDAFRTDGGLVRVTGLALRVRAALAGPSAVVLSQPTEALWRLELGVGAGQAEGGLEAVTAGRLAIHVGECQIIPVLVERFGRSLVVLLVRVETVGEGSATLANTLAIEVQIESGGAVENFTGVVVSGYWK